MDDILRLQAEEAPAEERCLRDSTSSISAICRE